MKSKSIFALVVAVLVSGCEYYDRPNRRVPSSFSAKTPDGKILSYSDFEGKPLVLSVYAPGCHICAKGLPDMEALREEFEPQGVQFLAVSLVEGKEKNATYLQRLGVHLNWAVAQGEALDPLSVRQIPATVFINRQGTIVKSASGLRKRPGMKKIIQELIKN